MNSNHAWVAGFLDGEGTVTITRTTHTSKAWRGRGLRLFVAVSQVKSLASESVLRQLQGEFGGSVHYVRRSSGDYRYWVWNLTGDGAASLLRALLPYLRLKRRQTIDGLRFYRVHQKHCPQGYGSRLLSSKARMLMERLHRRVQSVNRPQSVRP